MTNDPQPRYYIGLMSGTSMDAVDAALVDLSRPSPRLLACESRPYPEDIRKRLGELCQTPGTATLDEAMTLDVQLGRLFAAAATAVIEQASLTQADIRAIGSHGQTLYHAPGGDTPFTLQIADPNIIAELTGITTVADFRRRDIAAGGAGAPFAPLFHDVCFRRAGEERVVLNIGGIANITYLPGDTALPASGFDTGPGNTLMDGWIAHSQGRSMDKDGQWAAGGQVHSELLEILLADAYFRSPPPKSTGREYFNLSWLNRALKQSAPSLPPQDVQATLCELTAYSISNAIHRFTPACQRLIVCGGGAHNTTLMRRLAELMDPCPVVNSDACGLPPDWVEAAAFAWLAQQTLEGRAMDLRAITGARHAVVLGGIYL